MKPTIFCDIDGTLFHQPNVVPYTNSATLLSGVVDRTYEWAHKNYTIILTTGRKESERVKTIKQLSDLGVVYDKLIMGLGTGPRVLINDMQGNTKKAFAINVQRNLGIKDVDLEHIINRN